MYIKFLILRLSRYLLKLNFRNVMQRETIFTNMILYPELNFPEEIYFIDEFNCSARLKTIRALISRLYIEAFTSPLPEMFIINN